MFWYMKKGNKIGVYAFFLVNKCWLIDRYNGYLAALGKARGCSTNTVVINSVCDSPFSSHGFMVLPRPNGLKWYFQS